MTIYFVLNKTQILPFISLKERTNDLTLKEVVCSLLFSPEWLASVSDDMWVHVQDCLHDTTV